MINHKNKTNKNEKWSRWNLSSEIYQFQWFEVELPFTFYFYCNFYFSRTRNFEAKLQKIDLFLLEMIKMAIHNFVTRIGVTTTIVCWKSRIGSGHKIWTKKFSPIISEIDHAKIKWTRIHQSLMSCQSSQNIWSSMDQQPITISLQQIHKEKLLTLQVATWNYEAIMINIADDIIN